MRWRTLLAEALLGVVIVAVMIGYVFIVAANADKTKRGAECLERAHP